MSISSCPTLDEIGDFRDGTMPLAGRERITEHLRTCSRCQRALQGVLTGAPATPQPGKAGAERASDRTNLGFRPPSNPHHTPAAIPEKATVSVPRQLAASPDSPEGFPYLSPPLEAGELGRLGIYRVLRMLGSGGMGVVFLAEDSVLRRPVALKIMRPETTDADEGWKRLLREARSMAAIRHDNLVTVYQAGQEEELFYVAMELLKGETLDQRIKRDPPISVAEILRIAREIANGLGAVHQHQLIHRDIKPSNIWLEAPGGQVKILDFGLARSADASAETKLTAHGIVIGTPAFMSPEQARGANLDSRSDLFSLGCVLYSACTGRMPFQGETIAAQLMALAADRPPPVHEINPQIPLPLSHLVMQLLEKNPDARPASTADLLAQLHRIGTAVLPAPAAASALSASAPNANPPGKVPLVQSGPRQIGRPKERAWLIGVLSGGICAAILLAAFAFKYGGRPSKENAAVPLASTPLTAAKSEAAELPPEKPRQSPPPPELSQSAPGQEQALPPRPGERPPRLPQEDEGGFASAILAHTKAAAGAVFAADLKTLDMDNVYFPAATGKEGRPDPRAPPDVFRTFTIDGTESAHGIGLHPSPRGPAFVELQLDQRFSTFHAVVSQNDGPPPAANPMIFTVIADGKPVWRSEPLRSKEDTQRCKVSVSNVKVLRLEVSVKGDARGAHGLWFEPCLKK